MADDKTEAPTKSAAFNSSSRSPDPPPSSAVRHRIPQRQTSNQSLSQSQSPRPSINRRRSSVFSYSSIEDVTNILTDDLINPSFSRAKTTKEHEEVTHWHSTPLAFAILPAVGGLLFKNGSAFVTDILLIVLAAIFMNWSIRLPWDWYYSAQAQRRDVEPDYDDIAGDMEGDETAVDSASSAGNSPKQSAQLDSVPEVDITTQVEQKRADAAAELRSQEKIALLATFLFPILAAYLLHKIREQLSQSSTGLVSDYNLTIFLLAAEVRPCRQLIRLVTTRTMHLQRTVTGLNDPFGAALEEKTAINTLTSRIAELETKLADHAMVPQNISIAQKADVSELWTEVRKRYEPRLEGLERAVRRYEKRQTTLAMLTEQRLGSLDTRLQDALSLAAAAAQQSQTRGTFTTLLDNTTALVLWPLKVVTAIATSPLHMIEEAYAKLKGVLLGPAPLRSSKRNGLRQNGVSRDEKVKDKASLRKTVR